MSGSIEELARRRFEVEEDYGIRRGCGCLLAVPALLLLVAGVGVAADLGLGEGIVSALIGVGGLGLAVWLIRSAKEKGRRYVSRRMKEFLDGDPDTVELVLRTAVEDFRHQIAAHRSRTVGSDSEWSVARTSLQKAADEAHRSLAYWRTRLGQEPGNRMARDRLGAARELEAKLRSALNKLDARADLLREFYNDCEARIAVMDQHSQDIEENRRLEALSASADVVIADATAALSAIGAGFVHEARRVGRVLNEFERLQIKSLAGEAPLEDIEYLADRIIECSDSELAIVTQLKKELD